MREWGWPSDDACRSERPPGSQPRVPGILWENPCQHSMAILTGQKFVHALSFHLTLVSQDFLSEVFFFFFFGPCAACGILVPWPGNPCPLQWKCGVLTAGPPGKSLEWDLLIDPDSQHLLYVHVFPLHLILTLMSERFHLVHPYVSSSTPTLDLAHNRGSINACWLEWSWFYPYGM